MVPSREVDSFLFLSCTVGWSEDPWLMDLWLMIIHTYKRKGKKKQEGTSGWAGGSVIETEGSTDPERNEDGNSRGQKSAEMA